MKKFYLLLIVGFAGLITRGQDPDTLTLCSDNVTVSESLSDVTECLNTTIELTYEVEGTDFSDFSTEWYWDTGGGFELINENGTTTELSNSDNTLTTTLDVPNDTPVNSVEYFVLLFDDNDDAYCRSSVESITIHQLPSAPVIEEEQELQQFCQSEAAEIDDLEVSSDPDTILWFNGENPVVSGTSLQNQSYFPIALDTITGCQSSLIFESVEVEILDTPTASLVLTGDDTLCFGDELPSLTINNESGDPIDATITWTNTTTAAGGTYSLQVDENLSVNIEDTISGGGVYEFAIETVAYSTEPGCENTNFNETITVTVHDLPDPVEVLPEEENQTFCESEEAVVNDLEISFDADPITWFQGTDPVDSNSLLESQNYFPAYQDSNGCWSEFIDPVTAEILDPPSVDLGVEDEICLGDPLLLTLDPEVSGTLSVEIGWESDSGDDGSIEVDIDSSIQFDLQDSLDIAAGDYEFIINTVSYSTGPSCENIDFSETITVTVHNLPPSPQLPENLEIQSFCSSSDPTVNNLTLPGDANNWFANGDFIDGTDQLDDSEYYFPAEVVESTGCFAVATDSVEVELVPDPSFEVLSDNEICNGDTVEIWLSSTEMTDSFCVSNLETGVEVEFINGDCSSSEDTLSMQITVIDPESEISWDGEVTGYNTSTINTDVECAVSENIDPILIFIAPVFQNNEVDESGCLGDTIFIDPAWNGVGDPIEWEFSGPLSNTTIDDDTYELSIFPTEEIVPGEEYSATISGLNESCYREITYSILYNELPSLESKVIDDPEFCHGEYNTIQIINPNPDLTYEWDCVNCDPEYPLPDSSAVNVRWLHPDFDNSDSPASAEYTVTATSNITGCSTRYIQSIDIQADYSSCPEGIAFFEPNGLSITDFPAKYFEWGTLDEDLNFEPIDGQTNQTFFPTENINACDPGNYVVRSSLFPDRCWTTTTYCYNYDVDADPKECAYEKSAVATSSNFDVYPNPNNGKEIILREINGIGEAQFHLSLCDLTGKEIYSTQLAISGGYDTKVLLPDLVQGLYVLRLNNESADHTLKIIVN